MVKTWTQPQSKYLHRGLDTGLEINDKCLFLHIKLNFIQIFIEIIERSFIKLINFVWKKFIDIWTVEIVQS